MTNELAMERNREAAERTLTSWIQSCLSLIGFGFAFDAVLPEFQRSELGRRLPLAHHFVPFVSLTAVGFGVFLLALAIAVHRSQIDNFQRAGGNVESSARLALFSAGSIVLLGAIALTSVFLKLK